MTQLILISIIMISTTIFIQMIHPLALGLMLLVQTLLICLISGLLTSTFWFSYILFLIFLGGMLVLFIYVTSLASNEMFSLSMKSMMISMIMLFVFIIMYMMTDKTLLISFLENNDMKTMNFYITNKENMMNLIKLYNFPTNLVMIMMINYLFITLIASVNITNVFYGPLRQNY
uniref:NADH dehydrogenase subunit 6 n=1 Tax=Saropogon luteus TaxID=468801 RepID=UPI0031F3D19D